MPSRAHIVYYITAHGYGHGVRSCEILEALRATAPDLVRTVVTALPSPFLETRITPPFTHRNRSFDVGMVQLDSIRIDLDATEHALRVLCENWEQEVLDEGRWLAAVGATVVVADIPGIPMEAARRIGIPVVAVGNFGWDWIYSGDRRFSDPARVVWRTAVDRFANAYAKADLLLRLPFAEPMAAFPKQIDLPLLGSPGQERRKEIAIHTGADPRRRWVLLSFTTLDLTQDALRRLESLADDYELFTVRPLEFAGRFRAIDPARFPFKDVLASADAVVSKPGFGIVSECILNAKPLLHAERTDFREYPILLAAIERYLQHRLLPAEALYDGRLELALAELWRAERPRETLVAGGAEIAAHSILR